MSSQEKYTYPGEQANVEWDGRLCIHYGECGRASGDLFVGGRQPWCQPDLSSEEEIRDVLLRCPTGALSASFADGTILEEEPVENQVTVTQNGPLYVRGSLEIEGGPDDMPGTRYRAALCRCGESKNKPYCDNSHIEADFSDSGAIGETGPGFSGEGGKLHFKPLTDGPVIVKGKLTLYSSSGRKAWTGESAALCRCGESKNKPFCDGSHSDAGFKSD